MGEQAVEVCHPLQLRRQASAAALVLRISEIDQKIEVCEDESGFNSSVLGFHNLQPTRGMWRWTNAKSNAWDHHRSAGVHGCHGRTDVDVSKCVR